MARSRLAFTVSPSGASSSRPPGLGVAQGRRLAFVRPFARALDTRHRIEGDGVGVAQILKEGREGSQRPADARIRLLTRKQRIAPGDHMRAGDEPQLLRGAESDKAHKVGDIALIGAPGLLIADVGKPLDGRGHLFARRIFSTRRGRVDTPGELLWYKKHCF